MCMCVHCSEFEIFKESEKSRKKKERNGTRQKNRPGTVVNCLRFPAIFTRVYRNQVTFSSHVKAVVLLFSFPFQLCFARLFFIPLRP